MTETQHTHHFQRLKPYITPSYPLALMFLPHLSSMIYLEAWREWYVWLIHKQSFIPTTLSSYESLQLPAATEKIKVHLIKADNTKLSSHLEGNLVDTSCLFDETTVVGSIGDPQPWRNQWLNLQYQPWIPNLGMGIHTNPNMIGNHHQRLATTNSAHLACQNKHEGEGATGECRLLPSSSLQRAFW